MNHAFILTETRLFRSVCDIQSQDDITNVVGVYASLRDAKVAMRDHLAANHHPCGDESFYFGMWRGPRPETDGWPDLEEWLTTADEEHIKEFKRDHAALLAGEPGAEDRFKLCGSHASYPGYSHYMDGKIADDVIDMEDGMLPFKWNERKYADGHSVSTYYEDTSFATEGMEAITLQISKHKLPAPPS